MFFSFYIFLVKLYEVISFKIRACHHLEGRMLLKAFWRDTRRKMFTRSRSYGGEGALPGVAPGTCVARYFST